MKEAVWFKNGKEISWVDPVEEVVYDKDITKIRVFNGNYWYDASDCREVPDDFVVRERVDEEEQCEIIKVIRCKDCDVPHNKWTGCPKLNGLVTPPNFYCAFGRPKIIEDIL